MWSSLSMANTQLCFFVSIINCKENMNFCRFVLSVIVLQLIDCFLISCTRSPSGSPCSWRKIRQSSGKHQKSLNISFTTINAVGSALITSFIVWHWPHFCKIYSDFTVSLWYMKSWGLFTYIYMSCSRKPLQRTAAVFLYV